MNDLIKESKIAKCVDTNLSATPLKKVCAWCDKVLVDGPPERVSHGACVECGFKEVSKMIDREWATKLSEANQLLNEAADTIDKMLEYEHCDHNNNLCVCPEKFLLQKIIDFLDKHDNPK